MKTVARFAVIAAIIAVASCSLALAVERIAYAQGQAAAAPDAGSAAAPAGVPTIPTDNPIATVESAWSALHHYGIVWGGMVVIFAIGTVLAKKAADDHWLKADYALPVVTGVLGTIGAALDAKFDGASWSVVATTAMGAVLLIIQHKPKSGAGSASNLAKVAVVLLVGAAGAGTVSSCTHAQYVAMTGSFKACAKADLGQLVKGVPLATYVAQLISADVAGLEADLVELVAQVGVDGIECAVAAYESTHTTATAGAGSGSAATSMPAPDPGLARAKAWIAAQRAAAGK